MFNFNFLRQDISLIRKVIPNLVTEQTNEMLTRIPNDSEVLDAILNLNIESTSGPDGFEAIILFITGMLLKLM